LDHILKLDGVGLQALHDVVFPSIATGRTILFLGAGASVTDKKKFLSKELIDLYSVRKGINLETNDIIDFVDTLSSNPNFSRNDFDEFVDDRLRVLKVTDTHKIIASLNWKEIITTNFDLLIEKAFDEITGTPDENLKPIPVRRANEYYFAQDRDELKYVKLNGCLSDKKKYPLVFSSKDFEKAAGFYKTVLRSLENLSPKIAFLSVGYSYSDEFSKALLNRFDKYGYRNRRWMLSVDPFLEDARLPYFTENRICVIRTTAEQFFQEYKKWEDANADNIATRRRITYINKENRRIQIPNQLALRIANDLVQISDSISTPVILPERFYRGEEPTYDVVRKNLDVVKQRLLKSITEKVEELLTTKSTVVPILFLEGSYGTGKTTLCYRIISQLIHDEEFDALGFEVIDASKLKAVDLDVVFTSANSTNIILFFNGIEVDSAFKALMDFRARISSEQFQNFKVLLLASIRGNILSKYKARHSYINTVELNVDEPFTEDEAKDLVDKLGAAKLVDFRDANERNKIASKIVRDYSGDTLISLISLVADSSHDQIVRDAYLELTPLAQAAFLYTSLLYRFNLQIPAGLLRALLSKTWDEFTREVLEYDSKGVLIQEEIKGVGTNPDIYLRTKHPIISNVLVDLQLSNADLRFEKYREIIQHLNPSIHSSTLIVDLLKALRDTDDFSQEKIDRLYDAGSQIFYEDPHFNLHYAINLQYRNTEDSLNKGIERIKHSESFLERRSHYLTHRRAVLNFRLAQLVSNRESSLNETWRYIQQARMLFDIKLVLDPFSYYSYVEYIRFELWFWQTVKLNDIDEITQRIKIEELLERAEKSVLENAHIITQLRADYLNKVGYRTDEERQQYLEFLEDAAQDPGKRPYALILLFYYFERMQDEEEVAAIISELESQTHLDEVAKVLFQYYGKHLYDLSVRLKFFNITNAHPEIEKKDSVRYHYYSFVAEAYNKNFHYAYEHVGLLRGKFTYLNPAQREVWRDEDTSEEKVFEGIIRMDKNRKRVRVIDLQQTVDLVPDNYSAFPESSHHNVILHFYLNGIKAEIVQSAVENDSHESAATSS
jgi:hypothetical protein